MFKKLLMNTVRMFLFLLAHASAFAAVPSPLFTIVLDSAGDATHPGRKLNDGFERGLTLQCVEQLQTLLHASFPHEVRVVLARLPGQKTESLHNAQFSNRLEADLYLKLSFFQEDEGAHVPSLWIYTYTQEKKIIPSGRRILHPPTKKGDRELTFCRYDKAHVYNQDKTEQYAALATKIAQQDYVTSHLPCKGCFALPCKPLAGILAPALCIEVGFTQRGQVFPVLLSFLQKTVEALITTRNGELPSSLFKPAVQP
jgi:hypothetical protein